MVVRTGQHTCVGRLLKGINGDCAGAERPIKAVAQCAAPQAHAAGEIVGRIVKALNTRPIFDDGDRTTSLADQPEEVSGDIAADRQRRRGVAQ